MKFKKDDICRCKKRLYSLVKGEVIRSSNSVVRVTSISNINPPIYNVYNLDFRRYEKIGEFYLKIDESLTRNFTIEKITNG